MSVEVAGEDRQGQLGAAGMCWAQATLGASSCRREPQQCMVATVTWGVYPWRSLTGCAAPAAAPPAGMVSQPQVPPPWSSSFDSLPSERLAGWGANSLVWLQLPLLAQAQAVAAGDTTLPGCTPLCCNRCEALRTSLAGLLLRRAPPDHPYHHPAPCASCGLAELQLRECALAPTLQHSPASAGPVQARRAAHCPQQRRSQPLLCSKVCVVRHP